jgi:hypothetical protein
LAPWNFKKPDITKAPIDPVIPILATTFRFRSAGTGLLRSILLVEINIFRFIIRDLTAMTEPLLSILTFGKPKGHKRPVKALS